MILFILLFQISSLGESLTFHAPFDSTLSASFAIGDPELYQASEWDERHNADIATLSDPSMSLVDHGVHGGALKFSQYVEPLYFFKAKDNFTYQTQQWNATVSFWLKLDPNEDLTDGQWCDPIMITASAWDDGSVFVDFTRDPPRQFRFAAFADHEIWNPDNDPWEEMAPGVMPMITISDPPFENESWTHVVLVLHEFNTDTDSAVLSGYFNGELAGELTGRDQAITWDTEEVLIQLGLQFRGEIDDLSLFNRALSAQEVKQIYSLPEGIASLYN
ncbi:MAG: LamG domain-containing protein [Bacteroidetes bacterium]|nr:LamG domain-containing protein [Bacteroidota bacterium]